MKRVLIVDDEDDLIWTLSKNLKDETLDDVCLLTARSAEEALKILLEESVDLLVTDIRMPGMSGLDLLLKVKTHHPQTDIIIMTAYPSGNVRRESAVQGSTRFIEKPFDINELRTAIRLVLDKGPGFRGTVAGLAMRGIRLVDAVKLLGLLKITAAVKVKAEEREGVLYFQEGSLVHAFCGELRGEGALALILEFERGTITISPGVKPALQTLSYGPDDLMVERFLTSHSSGSPPSIQPG